MLKLNPRQRANRLEKLKLLLIITACSTEKKLCRKCNNSLTKRNDQGHYNNLVQEMRLHETLKFFDYHRMSVDLFDELLEKVTPRIEKLHFAREPISAGARLSITLRYLASGDLMRSLSYNYRVSEASTSIIISETCEVIWNVLFCSAFETLTETKWKQVEQGFHEKWNFPNCIGALDGKHCVVQAFPNSGSNCSNYKSSHSIVLMAICDAEYNFLVVDIGSSGRFSDSCIFKNTAFGKAIMKSSRMLNLPEDKILPGTNYSAPHVIVGDKAFPLIKNIMRPFAGRNNARGLPEAEATFNYRLSRVSRVIENALGILAAKWRIFRRPIHAERETVVKIIKASVCLHNWVKEKNKLFCPPGYTDVEDNQGNIILGRWRQDIDGDGNEALQSIGRTSSNNSSNSAVEIRNKFKQYFHEVDVLPWQNNILYNCQ